MSTLPRDVVIDLVLARSAQRLIRAFRGAADSRRAGAATPFGSRTQGLYDACRTTRLEQAPSRSPRISRHRLELPLRSESLTHVSDNSRLIHLRADSERPVQAMSALRVSLTTSHVQTDRTQLRAHASDGCPNELE